MKTCARLLAVLFLSSFAPTARADYSVGFRTGYTDFANHLDHAGGNRAGLLFANAPVGILIYKWNGTFQGFDPPTEYLGAGEWDGPEPVINAGEAAFLRTTTPFTNTFTGAAHTPVLPLSLTPGRYYFVSDQLQQVGTYESITGLSPVEGSQVFIFNRTNANSNPNFTPTNYFTYTFRQGAWQPATPSVPIGAGMGIIIQTNLPPVITAQPQNTTNAPGSTATFSVSASGSQPLNYQWLFNGTNLPGATNTTLILSNVVQAMQGLYRAVVTNLYGALTSVVASLSVAESPVAPSVDVQPPEQFVPEGGDATFQATATGTPPLNYQWLLDGIEIMGATNSSLTLSNLSPADSGRYSIVVNNDFGAASSEPSVLTVVQPFTITVSSGANGSISPAGNFVKHTGEDQAFTAAPASGFIVEAWFADSVSVQDGGTNYLLANIQSDHSVHVTFRTAPVLPVITMQPQSQIVNAGSSASFSVAASGSLPLSCQWVFNGADLDGQTNTTLSVPSVVLSNAGTYTVVVDNEAGAVASVPATLTVSQPYTINASAGPHGSITPSGSIVINAGGNLTFNASPDPGYRVNEWLLDGVADQLGDTEYGISNLTTNHILLVAFQATSVPSSISLSISLVAASEVCVIVHSIPDGPATIEISSNLVQWTPLVTLVASNGVAEYCLPFDPGEGGQFFRGRDDAAAYKIQAPEIISQDDQERLVTATITGLPAGLQGINTKWSVEGEGAGKFRPWADANQDGKNDLAGGVFQDTLTQALPNAANGTLEVGFKVTRPGKITIKLTVDAGPQTGTVLAKAESTALKVDLTIYNGLDGASGGQKIAEEDEETKGAVTAANLNDTDGDGRLDKDDSVVRRAETKLDKDAKKDDKKLTCETVAGYEAGDQFAIAKSDDSAGEVVTVAGIDVSTKTITLAAGLTAAYTKGSKVYHAGRDEIDLMKLELAKPAPFLDGKAKLKLLSGEVKLWEKPTKEKEIALPKEFGKDELPATVWVEARAPSAALRDIALELEYKGCKDTVKATAVWANKGDGPWAKRKGGADATDNPKPGPGNDLPDLNRVDLINLIEAEKAFDGSRYGHGFFESDGARDTMQGGRILWEFKVVPETADELGVVFDVTRQLLYRDYGIANGAGTLASRGRRTFPYLRSPPRDNEEPNDDGFDTDEDNTPSHAKIYSYDAPGAAISIGGLAFRISRNTFKEWVRLRVLGAFTHDTVGRDTDDQRNLLEGSRISDKRDWHIVYYLKRDSDGNRAPDSDEIAISAPSRITVGNGTIAVTSQDKAVTEGFSVKYNRAKREWTLTGTSGDAPVAAAKGAAPPGTEWSLAFGKKVIVKVTQRDTAFDNNDEFLFSVFKTANGATGKKNETAIGSFDVKVTGDEP